MNSENTNQEELNQSNLVEHAKSYIETQKQNNEDATQQGWFELLIKDDLVGGWNEIIDSFKDAWEVANKMIDSMFGMNRDEK
ncbi:Uncharacterised protein [Chryseobacterium nakagawai]|uniref:Uncharacterized protein n=1 Tax=Chryseobacterium nakagawai TaxID=1241982 RepID=A0AAD0YPN4_CHRNA|nr:hypothetical protein [Chryseobacterium nakagawai]AZA92789.1 hypothetical protein EG343_20430 [Chryseobacterium nakagawai]VEH19395.1 Uncharacterised protein [Chryseobacterium nakagawai]